MSRQSSASGTRSIIIDVLCIIALMASVAIMVRGPSATRETAPPAATFPPKQQVTLHIKSVSGDDGAPIADYSHAAVVEQCVRAGLPQPPDLIGSDPVPLRRLFDAMERWINEQHAPSLGVIGQIYMALGLEDSALPLFIAAAELDSNQSALWWYFAGACCQRLGYDESAKHFLEQAAAADPSYPVTSARLATIALDAGDLDDAASLFESYRAARPADSLGFFGLAQVAIAKGNAAGAVTLLQSALAVQPNDSRAARLLARALALDGRIEESRAASVRAANIPEYFGWITFDERLRDAQMLANTLTHVRREYTRSVAMKDWTRAIAHAEEMRKRQPGDAAAQSALAAVYHRANRPIEALAAARESARMAPRELAPLQTLAEIALTQRQAAECISACDRMLEINPQYVRAMDLKSRAMVITGDASGALALLSKAIDAHPDDLSLRLTLAAVLQHAGRFHDAVVTLEDILRRDPTNRAAAAQLQNLRQQSGIRP